jgi:hypothetical protein
MRIPVVGILPGSRKKRADAHLACPVGRGEGFAGTVSQGGLRGAPARKALTGIPLSRL